MAWPPARYLVRRPESFGGTSSLSRLDLERLRDLGDPVDGRPLLTVQYIVELGARHLGEVGELVKRQATLARGNANVVREHPA